MSGISSVTGEHKYNTEFDRLMYDMEHGKIPKISEKFYRSAYYGTSLSKDKDTGPYDGRRLKAICTESKEK